MAKKWYRIEAKADETAEISIFDEIGASWFGGLTAKEFKTEFDAVKDAKAIRVLVNSPGGDVFDGLAIYNLLSSVREKVSVEVLGLAASAASIVALAGKSLTMGEGTYFMIHNPWALVMGTAEDMRKMGETLEKMRGQFADLYENRSSLPREDVLAAMDEETWYTAEEAVEAGFAESVTDYGEVAAMAFDFSKYKFAHVPGEMLARATRKPIPETVRDFESFLRDAGYSRSDARAIASRGFKGQCDAEPEAAPAAKPDYTLLLRLEENRRKARSYA